MKRYKIMILVLSLTAAGLGAAEEKSQSAAPNFPKQRPKMRKKAEHPGAYPQEKVLFWRVMSSLSKEERKALMETQAKNPEEFPKEIQKRMETFRAKEAELQKKFRQLVSDYQAAAPEKRKEIRQELTAMVREKFMRRMADNERHLQDMKRRTSMLEKELARKKENADQEIDRIVEKILSGERPKLRPGLNRKDGKAPEKQNQVQAETKNNQ